MSERGARYERSFNGLVGAVIVTVLVVVGFVVFTGVFRDPTEDELEAIDYVATVGDLQEAGVDVVYPADLPDGWLATDVRFEPGERPRFELNLYTDDEEFVGLRQVDADVDDLLDEAGVEGAAEEDPLTGVGAGDLAGVDTWAGWSDEGGDHAYSADVGGETVLVYGSVSAADLADLVGRLTTEPVPTPAPESPPAS